jgi:hypothetical protein
MGTTIPATPANAIFVQINQPSCASAGARVKVIRGQTFRYTYAPSTPNEVNVAWKEMAGDLMMGT